MDELLAVTLSHATRISQPMQALLWEHGNEFAHANLARLRDLREDLSDLIAGSRDDYLIAAWASAPRDRQRLRQAVQGASGERALTALAGQQQLDMESLDTLTGKALAMPGEALTCALIERDDLTYEQRHRLTIHYAVRGRWQDWPGENAMRRLGDHPATWAGLLNLIGSDQVGLLRCIPLECADDPEVQHAAVNACLRIGQGGSSRSMEAGILRILSSPTLHHEHIKKLASACAGMSQVVTDTLRDSLACDTASLLPTIACDPADPAPCTELQHVTDVETLSQQQHIAWGRTALPGAVLMHASDLPSEVVQRILDQVNPGQGRHLAERIKSGNADPQAKGRMLASIGRHVGTPVIGAGPEAQAAARILASEGCRDLLESTRISTDLHPVIVQHYTPARELLSNAEYASLLLEEVSHLAGKEQETTWGLLEEWEGSLHQLRSAAKALS